MAGDARATGRNGNATVSNNAGFSHAAAVAIIGSDLITAGDGDDWIAGDAMATDGGRAELITTGDDVSSLSRASSDTINGGGGNDTIPGDVLASGAGGQAVINGAGDDSIDGGAGDALIVGDALALDGRSAEHTSDLQSL